MKLVQARVALVEPILPDVVQKSKVSVRVGIAEGDPNKVTIAVIDRQKLGWQQLHKAADAVEKRFATDGALMDPVIFPRNEKGMLISIDREKAAPLGLTVSDAAHLMAQRAEWLDMHEGVAVITETTFPSAIYRIDGYPAIRITATPTEGKSLAATARKSLELAKDEMSRYGVPGFVVENLSAK